MILPAVVFLAWVDSLCRRRDMPGRQDSTAVQISTGDRASFHGSRVDSGTPVRAPQASPLVEHTCAGGHSTVLMFGQTGSGKTCVGNRARSTRSRVDCVPEQMLAGGAILNLPAPVVPASTRISTRLKCVQGHSSRVNMFRTVHRAPPHAHRRYSPERSHV